MRMILDNLVLTDALRKACAEVDESRVKFINWVPSRSGLESSTINYEEPRILKMRFGMPIQKERQLEELAKHLGVAIQNAVNLSAIRMLLDNDSGISYGMPDGLKVSGRWQDIPAILSRFKEEFGVEYDSMILSMSTFSKLAPEFEGSSTELSQVADTKFRDWINNSLGTAQINRVGLDSSAFMERDDHGSLNLRPFFPKNTILFYNHRDLGDPKVFEILNHETVEGVVLQDLDHKYLLSAGPIAFFTAYPDVDNENELNSPTAVAVFNIEFVRHDPTCTARMDLVF